jgi:surfactin family lipopeptide synthetase A
MASLLRKRNIMNSEIVGILTRRSIEMLASILAVLKAGGAFLPIDPDYPIERISYMLKDSNARFILTDRLQNIY